MRAKLYPFFIIGSLAAAIHAITLWLLVEQASFSPLYANPVAFLIAFICSFSGQYLWTFNDRNLPIIKALVRFGCVQLISGLVINQSIFSFCIVQIQMPYMLALLTSLILTACFTYIASHFWAFKSSKNYD